MPRLSLHRWLLACACLLLLGGCAMGERQEPKEPVITYSPVTHDIHYPQHSVILSDREEASLKAFLADNATNPGGNIALMAALPSSPKSEERLDDLRRLLHSWGYPSVVIAENPALPLDRIRVGSSTASAHAPDCPDWSYDYMANYRNSVLSNFGCASATNLVRMVEDPNDLVAGTGDSGADASRSSGVIEAYREPPSPPPTLGGESQTGGL